MTAPVITAPVGATTPRGRRPLAAASVLLAALVGVLALGWAQPASAHAALLGSDPEDGARLDALPARIALEFSEDMSAPAYLVVKDPDDQRVDAGEVAVKGAEVSVAVDDPGLAGRYQVAFRAVSADGHPVTGQFSFTVAGGSTASASPSAGASTAPSASPSTAPSTAPSAGASTGSEPESAAVRPTSATTDDDSGIGEVQVGVGIALFVVAGGLFWFSRRQRA
ncbi:copper resistance protein CopC [Nocardioides sp.]|uniref:copper resistance CopC family protein n=1 Tax=Nocardioides sp. TaxID=35761 RepID=UPI0035194E22